MLAFNQTSRLLKAQISKMENKEICGEIIC